MLSLAQATDIYVGAGGGEDAAFAVSGNTSGTNGLVVRVGSFLSQSNETVSSLAYNKLWVNNQISLLTSVDGTTTTRTIASTPGSFASDGTTDAFFETTNSSFNDKRLWVLVSNDSTFSSSTQYALVTSTNSSWTLPSDVTATSFQNIDSGQITSAAFGSYTGLGANDEVNMGVVPTTYLYWDAGEAGLGGAGTWNTTNTVWNTNSSGVAGAGPYAWGTTSGTDFYAGAGLTANFTGTAGTVTVSGTVQAHAGMEFHTTGYTLSSGTINLAGSSAATNEITVSTGTATISSVLTGSNGFQKYGTGTLTLSGANTYSGGTTMDSSSGTININNATAIGTGALTISGASTTIDNTSGGAITLSNNNNIALSGGSLTFTGTNDLSFGTGVVTLSGATSRTMTVNGGSLTVGSIDANATNRALVKAGSGTLLISGSAGANFQAGTTISGGTLTIGHQSALGTGAITIGSGTLTTSSSFTGASAVTNSIVIDSASAAIAGANNLELSGSITNSGGGRTLLINKTG
ncbi:MAG: autotransporter-associated beta strand repeat-containing protein, partial [Verrucomicrobia bacterium]|nr:autotransporter-associated beta strand repeat-containing protein [Verrucomicrobiota bacterium]